MVFLDTIEKNLNEYKYAKCSDLIAEIQAFVMTLFTLTQGLGDIRVKVSELLDFATENIR